MECLARVCSPVEIQDMEVHPPNTNGWNPKKLLVSSLIFPVFKGPFFQVPAVHQRVPAIYVPLSFPVTCSKAHIHTYLFIYDMF